MKIKLLHSEAKLPKRMTVGASGLDVFAVEEVSLHPNTPTLIPIGLAVEIPQGYELQLRMRSSFVSRHIIIPNGVGTIDADYRGEIKMPLLNLGNIIRVIKQGDRVGQLVMVKIERPDLHVVKELTPSVRGEGGFGSTNKLDKQ